MVSRQVDSFLYYSCSHTQRSSVGCRGQAHDEGCALSTQIVVTENLSSVFLHDAIADAEAQAGAFPDLFRRKKWIEDLVSVRDSAAVVAERNFNAFAGLGRHDFNARRAPHFVHGVVSIVQNIRSEER